MKKRIAGFVVLAVLAGMVGWKSLSAGGFLSREKEAAGAGSRLGSVADEAGPLRTKSGPRDGRAVHATHRPEQLRDFMLPAVEIRGLDLATALQRLYSVYQETCLETGEVPLELTFEVPPELSSRLTVNLKGSFQSSVRLLAAIAGTKPERDGTHYRFLATDAVRGKRQGEFQVAPDFQGSVERLAGARQEGGGSAVFTAVGDTPSLLDHPLSLGFRSMGLKLDPSTTFSLGANGILRIETEWPADIDAIRSVAEVLSESRPAQHKFQTQIVTLPAGIDLPDSGALGVEEFKQWAERAGASVESLPSAMTRAGMGADIEIVREWIWEVEGSPGEFEMHRLGKVAHVQGDSLGFGHALEFRYSDTTGEIDPVTGKAGIKTVADVGYSGFSGDQAGQVMVQSNPDGSRTLVRVMPTLVDATGRPLAELR